MASASLDSEVNDQKITYDVIREEDTDEVIRLLKRTFFKVNKKYRPTCLSRVVWFSSCSFYFFFCCSIRFPEKGDEVVSQPPLRYLEKFPKLITLPSLNKLFAISNNSSFAQHKTVFNHKRKWESFLFDSTQFPPSLLLRNLIRDGKSCWGGFGCYVDVFLWIHFKRYQKITPMGASYVLSTQSFPTNSPLPCYVPVHIRYLWFDCSHEGK